MSIHLHLLSFNVPYPPDYGGVIDVFYKIKALFELDVKIHLHSFYYDRPVTNELEKFCESVHYYERKQNIRYQFTLLPYMVLSRNAKELLKNLQTDNYPILFEGLHTTLYIREKCLRNRKKIIRMHNIEHEHYLNHGVIDKNIFRKTFFFIESLRLKYYERKVALYADHLLGISLGDHKYFSDKFGNSVWIPSFHPYEEVISHEGKGDYILYHGNLSLAENYEVVKSLIINVISKTKYLFIIAGMSPPMELIKICEKYPNTKLVKNPDNSTMEKLIRDAHIHLLMVQRSSGIRLKLLYSLYAGRHCIVNEAMLFGTNLATVCETANNNEEIIEKIEVLMQTPFTKEQIELRKKYLKENYENRNNARKIIELLG